MKSVNRKYLKALVIIFSFVFIQFSNVSLPGFAEDMYVTIRTDKPSYYFYREYVEIYGNIYDDQEPVEGGFVAIQLENGTETIMLRTVITGSTPSSNPEIQIVSVIPCTQSGSPKNDFNRGSFAYFNVSVRNTGHFPREVIIVLTVSDPDYTTLYLAYSDFLTIPPEEPYPTWWIFEAMIPDWSSLGVATAFASVLTDWPKNKGSPYCPEKSAHFNIRSGSSYSATSSTYSESYSDDKTYKIRFPLPPLSKFSNITYSINVAAYYNAQKNWAIATFTTKYHEIGDFQPDGVINIYDVVKLTSAYGSYSGKPNWKPKHDVKPDGQINIYDVVRVTSKYGKTYPLP